MADGGWYTEQEGSLSLFAVCVMTFSQLSPGFKKDNMAKTKE
jgi:hypothetical protein